MTPPGFLEAGQSLQGNWTDNGKPVARRGRKATGLGSQSAGLPNQEVQAMRAGSAIASSTRHVVGVGFQALLVVAIVAALVFAAATVVGIAPGGAHSVFAAKGGNGGGNGGGGGSTGSGGSTGGSYSINLVSGAGLAAVSMSYGATVNTLSSYGDADPAYARVACTANGTTVTNLWQGALVYDVFQSIREGTWNTGGYASFNTTGSAAWTGGGADCIASLMTYSIRNADRVWKELASTSFTVAP
jgi:hypothetical protein